ncbi:hypothetical protein FSP39_000102 [Pinctada imbricata]|uniref:Enoyl reductase (ER) domain-containing protein n=1 Tax=Pinctada imbricata TaxID=66713 RepID=A0AA89C5Z5_PINIB|nr:hypothetical protein FSP39_000102 [Pinctada imbricata]
MLDNEVKALHKPMVGEMSGISVEASSSMVMPNIPKGGLLLRVCYAGACCAEGQIRRKDCRPRLPGEEIAGVVQDVCGTLPNSNFSTGDHVILYPDEDISDSGYHEYIAVPEVENCLQVPHSIPMEIAAMLPGCGLCAYSAILKAVPHVQKLQEVKACVNVLIVGAGGVGLWASRLANFLIGNNNNLKLFVADNSIDKLLTAQEHGCYDIIHWNEEDHEQYIVERTMDACRGGVDVVIDFVSSPRTVHRTLKVLNREGLILVGGSAMSEVSINLNVLAAKQQSIVGIPKGTVRQLQELVDLLVEKKVEPPMFSVHPVEEASQVFEDLAQSRITGRAILSFNQTAMLDNN